jgi:hypothetical protein
MARAGARRPTSRTTSAVRPIRTDDEWTDGRRGLFAGPGTDRTEAWLNARVSRAPPDQSGCAFLRTGESIATRIEAGRRPLLDSACVAVTIHCSIGPRIINSHTDGVNTQIDKRFQQDWNIRVCWRPTTTTDRGGAGRSGPRPASGYPGRPDGCSPLVRPRPAAAAGTPTAPGARGSRPDAMRHKLMREYEARPGGVGGHADAGTGPSAPGGRPAKPLDQSLGIPRIVRHRSPHTI